MAMVVPRYTECMIAYEDGDGDVDGGCIIYNEEMPKCFSNLPVYVGDFDHYTGGLEGSVAFKWATSQIPDFLNGNAGGILTSTSGSTK
jgi:hypothetical protein